MPTAAAGADRCQLQWQLLQPPVYLFRRLHDAAKVDVKRDAVNPANGLTATLRGTVLQKADTLVYAAAGNIPLLCEGGDGGRIVGDQFGDTAGLLDVGKTANIIQHGNLCVQLDTPSVRGVSRRRVGARTPVADVTPLFCANVSSAVPPQFSQ